MQLFSHHGLCDFINVHGDNALRSRCYPKKALDMEHITAFMNDFISTEELENLSVQRIRNFRSILQIS